MSPNAMFFNEEWYAENNPDTLGYRGGLFAHFRRKGWKEGRSPHPLFDVDWYRKQMKISNADKIEPTSHYTKKGWKDLLSPHPIFKPSWYFLQNPDVLEAAADPLEHYLAKGWKEGRQLHPLFDTNWYLEQHPELVDGDLDPLSHFLMRGWKDNHFPHPLFDTLWYREEYGLDANTNPLLHYVTVGWSSGKSPHPDFDSGWYESTYLFRNKVACDPLEHYLTKGWKEGLLPHPDATPDCNNGTVRPGFYEKAALNPQSKGSPKKRKASVLRGNGRRGKLLLVTHDLQIGGAPQVVRMFADWVQRSTRFEVGIVAMRGGDFKAEFEKIAPVIVLTDFDEHEREEKLAEWAGEQVKAVLVNSVASGHFYKYWHQEAPSVAFIHELEAVLSMFPAEVELIKSHADHVVAGGGTVAETLKNVFDFSADKLTAAHSFIEPLSDPSPARRQQKRQQARMALGVTDDRILIAGCGVVHWRKSPDKFVETAERVLAAGINAEFFWLGGGPDEEACKSLVAMKGLADRIRFCGYEDDVSGKLAGADIFILSSQEDPFPLVTLYAAQAGAAVVCFEKAGGTAEFVKSGCGTAVSFKDVNEMAEAVIHYATNKDAREKAGEIGRKQVEDGYTVNNIGPMLMHHLRRVAGISPEVSVVVPNYNYEAYLPERLKSIKNQNFQDFEIILLDDASSDKSAEVLEAFAKTRFGTKVVVNTENSGSPFAQWLKGMDLAQADLIWLAEADDYCEAELLTTLLPHFDDRNMCIASCASVPVTANGEHIGDYRPLYLNRIAEGRWDKDYRATDHQEADSGLGIANTIPNASAVMFRKFVPDDAFVEQVTQMRLCGDWFFYIRAMKGGFLGFSKDALNFHRRHSNTVTHNVEGSVQYFDELAQVRTYIGQTYDQSDAALERVKQFLNEDITRFNVEDPDNLPSSGPRGKILPALAVIAPDLSPGGGQMFAISLVNEWSRRGGRVILINAESQPTHPAVVRKLDPGISLFNAQDPGFDLAKIVMEFDIDVLHSSIWWADKLVYRYLDQMPTDTSWIITMHGCHETLLENPEVDPSFSTVFPEMVERASGMVYTAEKNLAVFESYARPSNLSKIPNGMKEERPGNDPITRETLGLRPDAMVICLASRAIPSKGWAEAVEATQRLNAEGIETDLMLIGEGPSADALRVEPQENVHLIGQVANLQDYFKVTDVGILPSYFIGESLPLVLIEMMAKGLPIVASAVGEIPNLLGEGSESAGVVVPVNEGGLDMEAFLSALRTMHSGEFRNRAGTNSRARFDADFRLELMVDRYGQLYDEASVQNCRIS